MSIGQNIKRIRKEKGLTQKKLGELCGINEANIRKYELGGANPKIETIQKIASGLGVPFSQLLPESTPVKEQDTFWTYLQSLGYLVFIDKMNDETITSIMSPKGYFMLEPGDIEKIRNSSEAFLKYTLDEILRNRKRIDKYTQK